MGLFDSPIRSPASRPLDEIAKANGPFLELAKEPVGELRGLNRVRSLVPLLPPHDLIEV